MCPNESNTLLNVYYDIKRDFSLGFTKILMKCLFLQPCIEITYISLKDWNIADMI